MRACGAGEADGGPVDVEAPIGGGDGGVFDRDVGGFACCVEEEGWKIVVCVLGRGTEMEEWNG